MHDFIVNRYFFGDFSSATPGVSDNTFEELNHPIGQLYLAGEAYIKGLHSNTHGALIHGSSVAEIIAREIQGPLTSIILLFISMHDAIIQFCLLFVVTFVNNSPRLEGNLITAEFTVSRRANLVQCGFTGQRRINCMLRY